MMAASKIARALSAVAIAASSTFVNPAAASPDWLPAEVATALSVQLAERLATTQPGGKPNAARTREAVGKFAERIGTWGEKGVLQRAPALAALKLPDARQPHLNAMARYQVCNAFLLAQFEGNADPRQRVVGALGLTAVTMLQGYLRQPYLDRGAKLEGIEAFLTGPAFGSAMERALNDEKLIDTAQTECGPVVAEFLELL